MRKLVQICFLLLITQSVYGGRWVFRVDDFHLEYDSLQEKIIDAFSKHNIPLVIGVIPTKDIGNSIMLYENMPDTTMCKWIDLYNRGKIEIAMHGWSHRETTNGVDGEFTDALDEIEQYRRLKEGKCFIDSVLVANGSKYKTYTFIPPWNIYTKSTLRYLKELDFEIVSADRKQSINRELLFYPCTIEDFDEIPSLMTSNDGTIVILFHLYTFKVFSLQELDVLLQRMQEENGNSFCTFQGLHQIDEPSYDGGYIGKLQFVMKFVFGKRYYILNRYDRFNILIVNIINSLVLSVSLILFLIILSRLFHVNMKEGVISCSMFFFLIFMKGVYSVNIADKYIILVFILMIFIYMIKTRMFKNT